MALPVNLEHRGAIVLVARGDSAATRGTQIGQIPFEPQGVGNAERLERMDDAILL